MRWFVPVPKQLPQGSVPITRRQAKILQTIIDLCRETGIPPTRAEIAGALGLSSGATLSRRHLQPLAEKGYIEIQPGKVRGIRVLQLPPAPQKQLSGRDDLWNRSMTEGTRCGKKSGDIRKRMALRKKELVDIIEQSLHFDDIEVLRQAAEELVVLFNHPYRWKD